jgi:hypothetical protein
VAHLRCYINNVHAIDPTTSIVDPPGRRHPERVATYAVPTTRGVAAGISAAPPGLGTKATTPGRNWPHDFPASPSKCGFSPSDSTCPPTTAPSRHLRLHTCREGHKLLVHPDHPATPLRDLLLSHRRPNHSQRLIDTIYNALITTPGCHQHQHDQLSLTSLGTVVTRVTLPLIVLRKHADCPS